MKIHPSRVCTCSLGQLVEAYCQLSKRPVADSLNPHHFPRVVQAQLQGVAHPTWSVDMLYNKYMYC